MIASDLIGNAAAPLPGRKSQEKKWSKAIGERLSGMVSGTLAPQLAAALAERALPAKARVESALLLIDSEPLSTGTGYVAPTVMLEFGARSTGEPHEPRAIVCDAAQHLTDVRFPEATPQVMRPERTLWEKATAIHVFCAQGSFCGDARFARHWHDVTRLDTAGFANRALADTVAEHKSIFFAESTPDGKPIDYRMVIGRHLDPVPPGDARNTLADDDSRMVDDDRLLDDAEDVHALLSHCRANQDRVNAAVPKVG